MSQNPSHHDAVQVPRKRARVGIPLILSAVLALIAGSLIVGAPAASAADTVGLFGRNSPAKFSPSKKSAERGVKFSSRTDGKVVGLEFYRGPKQTIAYTGSLWAKDGSLLGRLIFPKSSRVGWQSASFATPIDITAGRTYVASYLDSNGRAAVTRAAFRKTYTRNGLTVPRNGGVYRSTRTSAMPTSTHKWSNYFVDVVFRPTTSSGGAPGSPTPGTTPTASATPSATAPPTASATPSATATATPTASATPTPTSTPSGSVAPTVLGWQLTKSNIGLAPYGLSCDRLPVYTGPLKPAAGARISGVRIQGNLDLSAGDIVVERSCIRPTSGDNRALVSNDICGAVHCLVTSPESIIIRDSEFDASAIPASQIAASCAFRGVGTLQRNYIHGMGSGICFFGTGYEHSGLAQQNYVTELRAAGSSHNEAATIRDLLTTRVSNRTANFTNNRLNCETGHDTGGLFIQPTWDDISNVYLEGNYIEGGGYNLFLNEAGGTYKNVHSVNNRFRPTGWGPSAVQGGPGWTEWSGNYIYDSSKADGKGAVVQPG